MTYRDIAVSEDRAAKLAKEFFAGVISNPLARSFVEHVLMHFRDPEVFNVEVDESTSEPGVQWRHFCTPGIQERDISLSGGHERINLVCKCGWPIEIEMLVEGQDVTWRQYRWK